MQRLVASSWRPPSRSRCRGRRGGWPAALDEEHRGAGGCRARGLAVEPLRVVLGPDQRDDHRQSRPSSAARPRGGDRRGQLVGRVGVGAVAEDDVEQQHAAGRGRRSRRRAARAAGSGRSSGGPGPAVSPSSPKSMITWASLRRSAPSASSGDSGMLDRIGPSAAPATSIASSARVPPQNRPAQRAGHRARRAPRRPARPRRRRGASPRTAPPRSAAVRSGRPGAERGASWTGVAERRGVRLHLGQHLGCRRLGHDDDRARWPGRRRAAASACRVERPPTAADRSRPPTPRQWLTPTPAASSRHMHLLGAGARGGDEPDRAGRGRRWRSRAPTPPTTAVPQSGPITSTSALGRRVLERDLVARRRRCRRRPSPTARRRRRRAPRRRRCGRAPR